MRCAHVERSTTQTKPMGKQGNGSHCATIAVHTPQPRAVHATQRRAAIKRLPLQRVRRIPPISSRPSALHLAPHWGLNPGPSVYKTDALPLSYRGLLCTSALWTSALQTQTLQPSHGLPSAGSRHTKYDGPIWQDTIHGHRVHSVVVSHPHSKQDREKRDREEKAKGGEGERREGAPAGRRPPAAK